METHVHSNATTWARAPPGDADTDLHHLKRKGLEGELLTSILVECLNHHTTIYGRRAKVAEKPLLRRHISGESSAITVFQKELDPPEML